jgi:hypothetical protein
MTHSQGAWIHEHGINFPEYTERRIGICRTNDGSICLSTFQEGSHHVFFLTDEQAAHLASLLMASAPS